MAPDYQPQLATLVKAPPEGDGWLHEVKYDGYRIGCRIQRRTVTLWSRRGNDWTRDFPEIVAAAKGLKARSALIDGEIAVLLPDGRTSFQTLQKSLAGERQGELVYFVFDLFELDGVDVSREPLDTRKEALGRIVSAAGPIRFSRHWVGGGGNIFREACRLGFEGLVSKRRDQAHRAGRSPGWLKSKCVLRQEFVIGGRGLHVVIPLVRERDWSECPAFSRALAEAVERQHRKGFTTQYAKAGRERKILLDYLRNNRTNTSIAAFSPRARDGAPVSLPIAWDELTPRLDPGRFNIESVPSRLGEDPWKEYWRLRQKLTATAVRAVVSL